MDIKLGRKDKIIGDTDIKKKFEEFSNGFFDDIAMELYEENGRYFLNLAPYTDKILNSNMCITASSKSELESIIEDLSCNIGIMLAEKSGKIQNNETIKQTVQIDGKEVSLVNFEQVHIKGENGNTELYKADELTEKIKSISSKVFSSEKDLNMSSYVKNTMFTRMNGRHTLEKEDFELLKYYKEEGYEFFNSFLGKGELKTRGNKEKEHIGKEFIDNLYKIDELFEKFPTLDESITVYRGATTKKSSNSIEYNSFVSTSLDRSVAENNFSKGRLYQINLPKGTHYIPMDAINGFEGMYSESEAEILLRPSSFNVMNREMKGDTEVLSVNAKEKGEFSEIIRKSLESRKEELIKKGLCNEKEFKEALDRLNEKHIEKMIIKAKANENRYKTYRMNIMKKITETRSKIDEIRENMPDGEIKKAEKRLKESELVQEYNSLINSAKGYDLSLKDINLLIQNLEGKIDKFERSKGLQELKQSREKLDKESEIIYSRNEVSKLENAVEMYKLQGNQEKVDKFNKKLEAAKRQYEYAKQELEKEKRNKEEQQNNTETIKEDESKGYSYEEQGDIFIEKQQQLLRDYSGKEIGYRVMTSTDNLKEGTEIIDTVGKIENEDGIYNISDKQQVYGGELQVRRKEINVFNKITGQKEQYFYQKDKNGNEIYYSIADEKLRFKMTKNDRGTTMENYDNGQLINTFNYDSNGKAIMGIEGLDSIDENYIENYFEAFIPYYKAENKKIQNDISIINTQNTDDLLSTYKNAGINQEDINKAYETLNRTKAEREQTQNQTKTNNFEGR